MVKAVFAGSDYRDQHWQIDTAVAISTQGRTSDSLPGRTGFSPSWAPITATCCCSIQTRESGAKSSADCRKSCGYLVTIELPARRQPYTFLSVPSGHSRLVFAPGSKRWGSVRLDLNVVSSSAPACYFDVRRSCRSAVSTSGTSFTLRKRTGSGVRRVLVGQFCSAPGSRALTRERGRAPTAITEKLCSMPRSSVTFGSGTVTSGGVSSKWASCLEREPELSSGRIGRSTGGGSYGTYMVRSARAPIFERWSENGQCRTASRSETFTFVERYASILGLGAITQGKGCHGRRKGSAA
jgi:hypothetical protein